jgi:hypothetical protein
LIKNGNMWDIKGQMKHTGTKRPGMSGPIKDAFEYPFMIVYGNENDFKMAQAEMDIMRNPIGGPLVVVSDIPFKSVNEITEHDIQNYNLILFGTPESNKIIKELQLKLPIQVKANGVQKGTQLIENTSAVFIFPNPKNPEKYIIIWSGRILSQSKKWLEIPEKIITRMLTLPDYIIFNNEGVIDAGLFNEDWSFPKNEM